MKRIKYLKAGSIMVVVCLVYPLTSLLGGQGKAPVPKVSIGVHADASQAVLTQTNMSCVA